MRSVQIRSLKQYKELRESGREFVPVIISDNYIFVGPSCRQEQGSSCLGCLLNSLKDNESVYYPLLKELLSEGYKPYVKRDMKIEDELVKICEKDTDRKVHIIDRGTLSVNSYPVYQHPACDLCEKNHKAEEMLENVRFGYEFNKAFRVKSPEDIMNGEESYENLINPHTGIGQYLFREIGRAHV